MNLKGLFILIRERFPLGAYGPMIAVFVAAHVILSGKSSEFSAFAIAGVATLTTSLFLRLRFFDEIKDYQVDLKINPTRPLPRGVITVAELKNAIAALTVFEVVASLSIFGVAGLWWYAPVAYSFLMYKEFFIGRLIRPHLTTYAVMHTLVSSVMVLAMLQLLRRNASISVVQEDLLLAAIAWPLFNLFEFGRKSYLPEKERAGVDTYSSLFGQWGAALLGISQIVLALVPLYFLIDHGISFGQWHAAYFFSAASILSALLYAVVVRAPYDVIYRALSSAHILFFYCCLIVRL